MPSGWGAVAALVALTISVNAAYAIDELSPQAAFNRCDVAILAHIGKKEIERKVIHAKSILNDPPYNVVEVCYETSLPQKGIVLLFARCPLDASGAVKFIQTFDQFESIRYCRSPTRWRD